MLISSSQLAAEVGLEASLALEGAGDETVSPRISKGWFRGDAQLCSCALWLRCFC